jgi:drug/metabolite transporter (DMT)-like permease
MYRDGADPLSVLTLRMGFSLPIYGVVLWHSSRRVVPLTSREKLACFGLGIFGYYGSSGLDFWGLEYISAGLERVILFTYPTFVLVLSSTLLRERIRGDHLIALVVTYMGIALAFQSELSGSNPNAWLGGGLVLGSALLYAGYIVGSAPYLQKLGTERFTSLVLLVSAVAVLLHFAVSSRSLFGYAAPVYGLGALMALLATVLPTFALAEGIRRIGPGASAILGTTGPVSTLFLAHVFLGEAITPIGVVGTALVLLGATLVALRVPT